MTSDHPPFEQLSELADGDLAADVAPSVRRHLADCATCRGELARLRAVLERAGTLAATIDPPVEAWSAIRDQLVGRSAPVRPRAVRNTRYATGLREWGLRAAAALVLVAGSSTLTVLVLRSRTPVHVSSVPGPAAVPAVPTALRTVDRSYADVLDELTTTIRAQRGALAPETLATLERTLRVIDGAIAEARAALAADPGNGALLDVLSANYEQKVQLLRRVSELPART